MAIGRSACIAGLLFSLAWTASAALKGPENSCGSLSLAAMARQSGLEEQSRAIVREIAPDDGFSLDDLVTIAAKYNLNLTPGRRIQGQRLPVPSIAHLRFGHFIAILQQQGLCVQIFDSGLRTNCWVPEQAINDLASGFFLMPASLRSRDFVVPDEYVTKGVIGRGYTTTVDDSADLYPGNAAGLGFPTWRVSQPFTSLWIQYPVIRYKTSAGTMMTLDIAFRQRAAVTNANAFSLGPSWQCGWLSTVAYSVEEFEDGTWHAGLDPSTFVPPLGGNLSYTTDGSTPEYNTYSTLNFKAPNGGNACSFDAYVTNSDGSQLVYDYKICPTCPLACTVTNYLSLAYDPQFRTTTFDYTTSNNIVLLQDVRDCDGHTNLLFYDSTFPTQVSKIVDPYLRTNQFKYDASGRLTNIINGMGMSFSFVYDSQGMITNMITPYGTNVFFYTSNTNSGNVVKRSLQVTEPDGRSHLFIYRDQSTYLSTNSTTALIPFSYPTNQVPTTSGITNTFDNTWMDARDSFYWAPHCYAQLSTNFLQTGNLSNLTTNDYLLADMRHWLLEDNSSGMLGNTLSMARQPSPNGVLEGQKWWLDYWGKKALSGTNLSGQTITNFYSNGTNINPSFVAFVLPDASSAFGYAQYNVWGLPLTAIGTYSSANGIALRTNTFTYAFNGRDLIYAYGTGGELLQTNGYNAYHQITSSCDAVGDNASILYNVNRVISITTPTGLVITNAYYTNGFYANFLQSTAIPAIGATNSFVYANGLLSTHTNERGLTTTNAWDNLLRPTSLSAPNGTVSITYTNTLPSSIVDQLGYTWISVYDSTGKKQYDADPLGRTNRYSFYSWGGLLAVTNPLQQVTSWTYDNLGKVLVTTIPDGTSSTNTFNLLGELTQVFDAAGNSLSYQYNNQGLMALATNIYGLIVSNVYDIKDRLTTTVDANGITNSFTYDLLNRVVTRIAGDGGVESFTYNSFGLAAYTNQIKQFEQLGYDVADRVTSETNANNEVTKFTYDVSGNLTNIIDGKSQSTSWGFDGFSRVVYKIDASGSTNFTFSYDNMHRVTNQWSAAKGTNQFKYDPVGNLTNIIHPVSPSISYAYDALNRLTNMVDALGTSRFQYTSFGALLQEDGPWVDDTATYGYAVNHLLTSVSVQQPNASPWVQTMNYDSADRLQTITSPAGVFNYAYQLAGGMVTKLSLPNGSYITNAFDVVGRLTGAWLKNSGNSVLDSDVYVYDVSGQITNRTRADGSYVNLGYDGIGQLKIANGFESGGTARIHEKFGFAYDAAHNLTFRTNNALVHTFNLNNLNQLTSITRSGSATVAGTTTCVATNAAVNGTTATRYGDNTFALAGLTLANGLNSFTATAQDTYGRSDSNSVSVTLPATISYVYDLNGNATSDGTKGFDYDDENQLIRITATNSWKTEFSYDGLGRRRIRSEFTWQNSSWVQTNQIFYVYSGNSVIQERDANNLSKVAYTRGLDLSGSFEGAGGVGGLLARTDCALVLSGSTSANAYYRADGVGNITSLINTQQVVVAKYLYDPFGRVLSQSGMLADANLYRFSSKEIHPNSGLYYFGARFYDPSVQRWLNRDPLGEEGGLNLYGFCGNTSVNSIDPWGLYDGETPVQSYGGPGDSGGNSDAPIGLPPVIVTGHPPTDVSDPTPISLGYFFYGGYWWESEGMDENGHLYGSRAVRTGSYHPGPGGSTVTPTTIVYGVGPLDPGSVQWGTPNFGNTGNGGVGVTAAGVSGVGTDPGKGDGGWKGIGDDPTKLYRALSQQLGQVKEGWDIIENFTYLVGTPDIPAGTIGGIIGRISGPVHHIATAKNWISIARGGPWSPRFAVLFKKAGMTLEDPLNKIAVVGHTGPHSEAYHQAVFDRLVTATRGLSGQAYRNALQQELTAMRAEVTTVGSTLYNLLMGK